MAAHLVRFRLSAVWVLCIALLVSGCVTTKRGGYTDKTDQNKAFETSLQLARSYIAQGNWDQAKRHLQYAESVDDNNPDTLEALALVFQNTGELETAESYYKRAIKQVPDRVRIRNNYAAFLFAQQRYAEAANQLEIVVEDLLYERRAEAFISLGRCYLQLDKLDKAENAFRRSLLMDNNNGSALLSMAEAVYRLERIAEAQRYYDAYRDKVKRQSAAGLWLGIRLADAFDDEDAFASYALALKNLYPKSEEFLKLKALQENRSQ